MRIVNIGTSCYTYTYLLSSYFNITLVGEEVSAAGAVTSARTSCDTAILVRLYA